MPLWGQVELLCRAIAEEGRREAENALSAAEAEAESALTKAREEAEKALEGQLLARRSAAYSEAKRIVDSTELEARKSILTFREQVVLEALGALQARLQAFKREPGYADFLLRALAEGIELLSGTEFVVELDGEDLDLLAETARKWAEDRGVAVDLRPDPSLDGGVRVYTSDRHLLYDNSLSARLRRNENELRQEIWRRVFGAEPEPS